MPCELLSESRCLGVPPAGPLRILISGFLKMYLRFWAEHPLPWSYSRTAVSLRLLTALIPVDGAS